MNEHGCEKTILDVVPQVSPTSLEACHSTGLELAK